MEHRHFQLKPSRLAYVFQLSIYAVLMLVLYQLLPLGVWLIALVAGFVLYLFFLRGPQHFQLQHLDGRDWSLSLQKQTNAQRVQISHIVDHRAYIVIYFQHFRAKPMLVWCDQLSITQWKALKILTKMQ